MSELFVWQGNQPRAWHSLGIRNESPELNLDLVQAPGASYWQTLSDPSSVTTGSDCSSLQGRAGGCSAKGPPPASLPVLQMTQLGVCPVRHFFISRLSDPVSNSMTGQPDERAEREAHTSTVVHGYGRRVLTDFHIHPDGKMTQVRLKWPKDHYTPCAKSPGKGHRSAVAEQPDKSCPLLARRRDRGTRARSHQSP